MFFSSPKLCMSNGASQTAYTLEGAILFSLPLCLNDDFDTKNDITHLKRTEYSRKNAPWITLLRLRTINI